YFDWAANFAATKLDLSYRRLSPSGLVPLGGCSRLWSREECVTRERATSGAARPRLQPDAPGDESEGGVSRVPPRERCHLLKRHFWASPSPGSSISDRIRSGPNPTV
ncbi:MAG: hypothetical protein KC931_18865, partial [Candidatus Omnitrophica bacterium]|nr:hypothetical protein [Candidatus Omnitrophota bacterium]